MAEQYSSGSQKIFYQATSGRSGVDVIVEICLGLDENNSKIISLVESQKFPGIYSFIYYFLPGVYIAAFYEGGIRTVTQVYHIAQLSKGYMGPQVL
jgi:hypothetical protein